MKEYTAEAKRFYNSKAWRLCREYYIATVVGGLCENCHRNIGQHVDHIVEIDDRALREFDTNILLSVDNLQLLCITCHNKKTHRKHQPIADGFRFDENGQYVPIK